MPKILNIYWWHDQYYFLNLHTLQGHPFRIKSKCGLNLNVNRYYIDVLLELEKHPEFVVLHLQNKTSGPILKKLFKKILMGHRIKMNEKKFGLERLEHEVEISGDSPA